MIINCSLRVQWRKEKKRKEETENVDNVKIGEYKITRNRGD